MSAYRYPKSLLLPVAGLMTLAGCSTTAPVEVTRFHLPQPIAPGSFVVEAAAPAGMAVAPGAEPAGTLESQNYSGIIAGQLTRLGFRPAPSIARAELVASFMVDRGAREDLAARSSGFSFGLGGFGGGGGYRGGGTAVGGGAGVTVPIGGRQPRYITGTRLMVQIKRRSDATVIWEGRAQTEAKASDPASQPVPAVTKLANALFTGFPGESGRTIRVK